MTPRYKNDSRKQKMLEVRQRLVNAAVDEFAREGYVGAKINRITKTAGVASGTIYNYFPSKKELMRAILKEIGIAHCDFIAENVRQEENPIARVEHLLEAGFYFMKTHPNHARVLFSTLQGSNFELKEYLSQIYQPMFQLISDEILKPGIDQNIFLPLNPVNTTVMIMTFYLGIGLTVNKDGETPLDLKEVTLFILRALVAN